MAAMATGARSDLPIMPGRPALGSIWRVNLSMRGGGVGAAGGAAAGLAGDAGQAVVGEHLAGELVHAGGGGGAGGADDFVADGVDRADVVDEAVAEVDGEGFAAVEHVGEALVGGVAAGEEFA